MKKLLALVLAVLMLASFAGCAGSGEETLGMSESPLAAPTLTVDYEIPADFKVGFICLHDEKSTYDLNFLNAVDAVQEATGLTDEQVLVKTNVPETDACYQEAADLVDQGCDLIFANSFAQQSLVPPKIKTVSI